MKKGCTDDAIAERAERCRYNMASIARTFGVNRSTIHRRVKANPKLAELFEAGTEDNLDHAESKLFDLIDQGNVTAIIFYLKTQGKARGYIERTEVSGPGGGPVTVEYVNDWRGR